jgi:hypothetical protein
LLPLTILFLVDFRKMGKMTNFECGRTQGEQAMQTTKQVPGQQVLNNQYQLHRHEFSCNVGPLNHNTTYGYPKDEHLTPALIWEQAKDDLIQSGQGYLTADDKVFVQKRLSKIEHRVLDPERDGKIKLGHRSSVRNSVNRGQITHQTMQMDSWHAKTPTMARLIAENKAFYRPIKKNRLTAQSGNKVPYRAVDTLIWKEAEPQTKKTV